MQSEHFITNSGEKSLSKILNGILPKSEALDFLVGYFYFSGINEIQESLGDKKMRILAQLAARKVVFITYRGNYIPLFSFMGDYGFFSHHRICLLKF